jgi:hypothetical protein
MCCVAAVKLQAEGRFVFSPQRPDRLWGPPSRGALSQEIKRQGRKADQLTPSTAGVKNHGAAPPFSHVLMACA